MRKTTNMRRNIRLNLMATASALALSASAYGAGEARAADADHPTLWVELGAQFEQMRGFGDPYNPPYTSKVIADGFLSPLKAQQALSQSFGEDSAISFQPENSNWILSASVRYGRANGGTTKHEQTPGGPRHVSFVTSSGTLHTGMISPRPSGIAKFSETRVGNSETHAILDFQAGRDLGLGLFNRKGHSTLSLGVRIAQFATKQNADMFADPDFYFPLDVYHNDKYHHTYTVTSHMERSFRGVGPSLSWNASAPLIGDDDASIALDWGVTVAALFGQQKAHGHHQTVGAFYKTNFLFGYHLNTHFQHSGNPDRSRSITVPNVGGFAGISFHYADAKVSLGYRGDFFFGAMDGGVDTRKDETRAFYGPFASISVGLGD